MCTCVSVKGSRSNDTTDYSIPLHMCVGQSASWVSDCQHAINCRHSMHGMAAKWHCDTAGYYAIACNRHSCDRCGHKNLPSEQLVSTTNQSNLAKNWLQYASNRHTQSTSIINTFLLATVAMPIDSVYSIHIILLMLHIVLSAHAHN